MTFTQDDLRYLQLLAKQYPSIRAAATEIINLSAILALPKGTEHFVSDIHGEYEPFLHVLRNGSGSIKRRIEEVFGWIKSSAGLAKVKLRGRDRVDAAFMLALAAYNLIRLPKLLMVPL